MMEYCPEIAVLHGAFELIKAESKAGKCDLSINQKDFKVPRLFEILRDVIQEIIEGWESPRSERDKLQWSRTLHKIFFLKTFTFNKSFELTHIIDDLLNREVRSFRAICMQIPDLHPFVFFHISDEFCWTDFLAECLLLSDLQTVLNFSFHAIEFCNKKPSLLYDLHVVASTLDLLVSRVAAATCTPDREQKFFVRASKHTAEASNVVTDAEKVEPLAQETAELVQAQKSSVIMDEIVTGQIGESSLISDRIVTGKENNSETPADGTVDGLTERMERSASDCMKQGVDLEIEDSLLWESTVKEVVDVIINLLEIVKIRNSTCLYDRSTMKSNAQSVTVSVLGQLLSSVIYFYIVTASTLTFSEVNNWFTSLIRNFEDDESSETAEENVPVPSRSHSVASKMFKTGDSRKQELPITEVKLPETDSHCLSLRLLQLCRVAESKALSIACLASFFSTQAKDTGHQKLPTHKGTQFGKILKLDLSLSAFKKPLKMVGVVQELLRLLPHGPEAAELRGCVAAMVTEMERREEIAEHRRNNPSLTVVVEKITKRQPRWKWCLQYGLGKRDLEGWWKSGFLGLLVKNPALLDQESHLHHLLSVLAAIAASPDFHRKEPTFQTCIHLLLKAVELLPLASQENVIVHVYKDPTLSSLLLIDDFEQSLTAAFNKLSAGTGMKNLITMLRLALQDPLAFTQHAVNIAVCNQGQISVVGKVLALTPRLMRCVHPEHHAGRTLLCWCVHAVLTGRLLDSTQQKNFLKLVTVLLKRSSEDGNEETQTPLLSIAEFISTSVVPFIDLQQTPHRPVSLDFALKLLTACFDVALLSKLYDWLENINPVVMVTFLASILHNCVELVGDEQDTENMCRTKTLVLYALDRLHKVFIQRGFKFEDHSTAWLQEKLITYDWTVSAYVAQFLVNSDVVEQNQILTEFALEAEAQIQENCTIILRLAAVSDAAQTQVLQLLQQGQHNYKIPYSVLVFSLCQVLPHILTSEVKRVVIILSELVHSCCVDTLIYTPPSDYAVCSDITGNIVVQALRDSVLLLLKQEHLSSQAFYHLAQIIVSAFQAFFTAPSSEASKDSGKSVTKVVFHHVCIIMSLSPDIMLEPLFITALDLVTKLEENEVDMGLVSECIRLIPQQGMQDTLLKKLHHSM